ncbi:DUF4013 domain-containing protein [Arenicella xantha]|uniref:B box-type domain-containing protein n=1 Tax=Arenicella xantha TaxID=644221 RepID=A0A395JNI7_9GAMM|nr:DUF4013 domain-containing protein [Arenicella xantha]RBP53047.1 hypothetical protein DFR28_101432 [Arenicella xantha]
MTHCVYHPTQQAIRSCDHCDQSYCTACSDESPLRTSHVADYSCFVCGGSLFTLQAAADVEPFWRRLGAIYQYPLSKASVAVILITALLSALFSNFGLLGLFPSIAMSLYCFACLRETATGDMRAPSVEASFEGSLTPVFSVLGVMFVATLATVKIFATFGTGFGILATFFFTVTLPAAILVLAIEEKFLPAIDPSRLLSVVLATGSSYFVMLLFLVMMLSSVGILSSWVWSEEPGKFEFFVQSVISNYYNIVAFHIMGYLVFQNRYRLGFNNMAVVTNDELRSDTDWLNAKLEVLVKAGEYSAAITVAKQQVANGRALEWQWARCFKLMCTGTSFKELKAFAPKYFDRLFSLEQYETIADSYVELKKRIRDYRIDDNERCIAIARALFEVGRYVYVVEMLQQFHTRTAPNELINESLTLLAKSYRKIPGKEKNAQLFQKIFEMRNSAT